MLARHHILRRLGLAVAVVCGLAVCTGTPAAADVPPQIPIQGYLTDADGVPLDGQTLLDLTLYGDDGVTLYTVQQLVTLDRGAFSTRLGTAGEPLDLTVFRDQNRVELGIAINGEPELSPRIEVETAPFAAVADFANDAATLQGLAPSDFEQAGQVDFGSLQNLPSGLDDGDDDTLGNLMCGDGQVAIFDGTSWGCGESSDTLAGLGCMAGQVAVFESGAWTCAGDFVRQSALATVATSGLFSDLSMIPMGLADGDDDTTYTNGTGLTLVGTEFALDTTYTDDRYINVGEANSITGAMIQDGAVGTNDIANGAVSRDKIANSAIDSTKIADSTITSADLAAGSVDSNAIADGSVDTADLADGAVTAAKLSGSIPAGDIDFGDGDIGYDSFTVNCTVGDATRRFVRIDMCVADYLYLADCDEVGPGAICEYDFASDCDTGSFSGSLDNCGGYDVYFRLD